MMNPENDPALQEKELREMTWALELAAARPVDAATAARIWEQVKGERTLTARVREGIGRGLRLVFATLVPESVVLSPAVRSGDAALSRLMVFETHEFAISLSFASDPDSPRVSLTGQVVPRLSGELPAGGKVAVWSGRETSLVDLNEHGEFAVDQLNHGDLHMEVIVGGDTIQISPIHTRTARPTES